MQIRDDNVMVFGRKYEIFFDRKIFNRYGNIDWSEKYLVLVNSHLKIKTLTIETVIKGFSYYIALIVANIQYSLVILHFPKLYFLVFD